MKSWIILAVVAANKALATDFCGGSVSLTATYKSATQTVEIVTTQPDQSWFGILLGSD